MYSEMRGKDFGFFGTDVGKEKKKVVIDGNGGSGGEKMEIKREERYCPDMYIDGMIVFFCCWREVTK